MSIDKVTPLSEKPDSDLAMIPKIVTMTRYFNGVKNISNPAKNKEPAKNEIYVMKLSIVNNNGTSILSQNLLNNLKYLDTATDRGVTILRSICEQPAVDLSIYIRDTKDSLMQNLKEVFEDMQRERETGAPIRHYFTQKLQLTDQHHNIDTGSSLVEPEDRPDINIAGAGGCFLFSNQRNCLLYYRP